MIVLDTNVLSELMNPDGSELVTAWADAQSTNRLFTTAVTQAEILYGIAILPAGARRQRVYDTAQALFKETFRNKTLPFGKSAAEHFAVISSHRRSKGIPISQLDAQIAAICLAHQATIATRNVKDFSDCQIDILNPWEA
ncbi:MAG: type II toxin-antitoxin system VapC family toxin [Cyanobacteria bacterium J06597_16]